MDAFALGSGLILALLTAIPHPGVAMGATIACFVAFLPGDHDVSLPAWLWQAVAAAATAGILHALLAAELDGDAAAVPVLQAWATTGVVLVVSRSLLRWSERCRRRSGTGLRRTLVVGAGVVGHRAAERLARTPNLGLGPVGFLDSDPLSIDSDLPVLGAMADLEAVVREHEIESVVIAFSPASNYEMLATVRHCRVLGLDVRVVPRLFEIEGGRSRVEHLGGLPIVRLAPQRLDGVALHTKYAVERVLAAVLVLTLAPVLLAVALAVRLTSRGPVLFSAPRTGAGGHPFNMLKFRTMVGSPNDRGEADATWADRMLLDDNGPTADVTAVPVIYTPIGRFLRRTSLDELPQLLSVLRGDMTLIGPRPERVHYATRFTSAIYRYDERHRIRPGMTGWAQVSGLRGRTSLADRIEWDMFYLENWSPSLDLKILIRTLLIVWRGTPE